MGEEKVPFPLHLFISNQSGALPLSDLEIILDGRPIFHQEMATGTQHNWEQITLPAAGKVTLSITETKTGAKKTEAVNVDRELWVVVTFHGPPPRLKVERFDYPVAFM